MTVTFWRYFQTNALNKQTSDDQIKSTSEKKTVLLYVSITQVWPSSKVLSVEWRCFESTTCYNSLSDLVFSRLIWSKCGPD